MCVCSQVCRYARTCNTCRHVHRRACRHAYRHLYAHEYTHVYTHLPHRLRMSCGRSRLVLVAICKISIEMITPKSSLAAENVISTDGSGFCRQYAKNKNKSFAQRLAIEFVDAKFSSLKFRDDVGRQKSMTTRPAASVHISNTYVHTHVHTRVSGTRLHTR